MGISATIAKPRDHVSKIWKVHHPKEVRHVEAVVDDTESPMGIVHHVMVRPRKGTPSIGALVDMTSAIAHQRRSTGLLRTTNEGWRGSRLRSSTEDSRIR